MFPLKPICTRKDVRKDGTSIVFIQYCFSMEKRTLLNTGIAIPPSFWNRKRLSVDANLPAQYGDPLEINEKIQKSMRIAQDILYQAKKENIPDPLNYLKTNFSTDYAPTKLKPRQSVPKADNAGNPKGKKCLYAQIDDYIKCKTPKVSAGMLKIYKNMTDHLKAFQDFHGTTITFQSFDYSFYEDFVDFLSYGYLQRRRKQEIKGLKRSTIGKTIKQLRIFIKDRVRRKIIAPIDLSDFKILNEDCDAIYLTWAEIEQIYRVDLTDSPHLVKFRDLFVLGCFTGLRFSDFSTIKPEDIRNDRLRKKQIKSDGWVVIPLEAAAEDILYNRFNKEIPKVTNPEFNRHIKEIGKLAGIVEMVKFSHKKGNKDIVEVRPKYGWITTHTCRRSFCTNEFLAGTPVELIMKISGHKSLRDFYRYIRVTPEEAANLVQDIWAKRGNIINMDHPVKNVS